MFPTNASKLRPWAPVVIRLGLAVIFIAHGGQKLFGIWGGPGLQTTIEAFERSLGVPSYLTLIVVGTEFFGGLTVLVGFLTRIAAAGLALLAMSIALLLSGPGKFALDRMLDIEQE